MGNIVIHRNLSNELLNKVGNPNVIIISHGLTNPTPQDVQDIINSTKYGFELNINRIFRLLCKQMPMLGGSLLQKLAYNIMEILPKDDNETALKNTYIKIHFWLYKYFLDTLVRINKGEKQKVVFDGEPSKYELITLELLNMLECDIDILVGCEDIPKGCENFEIRGVANTTKSNEIIKETKVYNSLNDLYTFISGSNTFFNTFVLGKDGNGNLDNFAYNLYTFLSDEHKRYKIIEKGLKLSDTAYNISKSLLGIDNKLEFIKKALEFVKYHKDIVINFMYEYLKSDSKLTTMKINHISWIISWINEYCGLDTDYLWIINCNDAVETSFIKLVRKLPINLIVFNTSKKGMNGCGWQENEVISLDGQADEFSIPKHGVVSMGNTLAYDATKRVDEMIFNGETPGVYRDNQYNKNRVITLNTTMDEVFIYWNQDIMFRPHFKSDRNKVDIPAMFIKVNGWDKQYKDNLKTLLGEKTLWINEDEDHRLLCDYTEIVHNSMVKGVNNLNKTPIAINGTEIDSDLIKISHWYKYGYISKDTEALIFDKIQELISKDIFVCKDGKKNKLTDEILNTLLNLDISVINMIQSFDFTKINPKLIITQEGSRLISFRIAIVAYFLHLIGFDVVMFVPTKYRGIEEYIDSRVIQFIELCNTDYNKPYTEVLNSKNKSLLDKLFKK